jgi:Glyoxalase/Bleomycin resistance protein/Dioxygenase superfamily
MIGLVLGPARVSGRSRSCAGSTPRKEAFNTQRSLAFAGMFEQCNVTLMVADMDRAVDFYTQVLKLPLRERFGND